MTFVYFFNYNLFFKVRRKSLLLKRPGVAGTVLQTFLWLIDWLTNSSFSSKSSRHLHSKTVWARDLKCWENVHLPPHVTCHVSHVMCHMWQSCGPSRWRVCYQLGPFYQYFFWLWGDFWQLEILFIKKKIMFVIFLSQQN